VRGRANGLIRSVLSAKDDGERARQMFRRVPTRPQLQLARMGMMFRDTTSREIEEEPG
jgi:hypothetical protein